MDALKSERRWCVWKKEKRNDRFTKVPYVDQDRRGKCNDPDTWLSYQSATELKNNSEEFDGLGFFLSPRERNSEYNLCVIDVDAHNGDGEENPLAQSILNSFAGTYAERSPSGNGYHILCDVRANEIPLDFNGNPDFRMKNSEHELENYIGGFTKRYMTYTGDQVSNGNQITDQTEQVLDFLSTYMKKPEQERAERNQELRERAPNLLRNPTEEIDIDINKRLNIARKSKDGKSFKRLYDDGDISQYDNDHSRADFALVNRLCYWIGPDVEKIDEAFRGSALMRDKWDEARGNTTYGRMTINNALSYSKYYYEPPESRENNQDVPWQDELRSGMTETRELQAPFDRTTLQTQLTPEMVLDMINSIEDDIENRDKITVLPLMCGTGKSSALRLKMQQIILANDGYGMIIVTDSIDRMRDYLLPPDDELAIFFQDYAHLITVMTYETLSQDKRNEPSCPILIMSTQRYINLSREELQSYLKWDGGYRSLIVVDEQPYFKKQIDISEKTLSDVRTAILEGFPDNTPETQEDKRFLADNWQLLTEFLIGLLQNARNDYNRYGVYYRWQQNNWDDPELFNSILKLLEKYKQPLNNYLMNGQYEDIFTLGRAIHQFLTVHGGLFQINVNSDGRKKARISVLLDNINNFLDIDAKVIILDGTADISTSYLLYDKDDFDIRDCSDYRRDMDLLNIKIVGMRTGKTVLMQNSTIRTVVFDKVKRYLDEHIPAEEQKAVFSYEFMKDRLIREYGRSNISWFGAIKGKNDFRQARFIAQIGLNRYQDGSYFLLELARNPDLIQELETFDYAQQDEVIKTRIKDPLGFTKEATYRELLAELEQNLFRGTIRNSDTTKPYTFFLFTSLRNRDFITQIHSRYEIELKGHVDEERALDTEGKLDFMARRYRDGELSLAQMLVNWHDKELRIGQIYSLRDIEEGTGLTTSQIRAARDSRSNKDLNDLFVSERMEGRNAFYRKNNNWYFEDDTELENTEEEEERF